MITITINPSTQAPLSYNSSPRLTLTLTLPPPAGGRVDQLAALAGGGGAGRGQVPPVGQDVRPEGGEGFLPRPRQHAAHDREDRAGEDLHREPQLQGRVMLCGVS